jgi:antitoxin component YwqK of YwqJK toxin-antitoxin module
VLASVLALLAVAAAPPLVCPKGTELRGAAPPDGFEAWCEGKDPYGRGRREGPARTWYDDGAPWVEQSFRAGILDGPFLERHRNGKLAREGAYAQGRKVGTWRIHRESGALEEESEWRDGMPHGRFAAWWPSGAPRTEGRYCGGAQCGRWRTFDQEGKPVGEVDYGEQRLVP